MCLPITKLLDYLVAHDTELKGCVELLTPAQASTVDQGSNIQRFKEQLESVLKTFTKIPYHQLRQDIRERIFNGVQGIENVTQSSMPFLLSDSTTLPFSLDLRSEITICVCSTIPDTIGLLKDIRSRNNGWKNVVNLPSHVKHQENVIEDLTISCTAIKTILKRILQESDKVFSANSNQHSASNKSTTVEDVGPQRVAREVTVEPDVEAFCSPKEQATLGKEIIEELDVGLFMSTVQDDVQEYGVADFDMSEIEFPKIPAAPDIKPLEEQQPDNIEDEDQVINHLESLPTAPFASPEVVYIQYSSDTFFDLTGVEPEVEIETSDNLD